MQKMTKVSMQARFYHKGTHPNYSANFNVIMMLPPDPPHIMALDPLPPNVTMTLVLNSADIPLKTPNM
jgi:hypothetical protein